MRWLKKGLIYGPHVAAEDTPDPVIAVPRAIYDGFKATLTWPLRPAFSGN